MDLFRPLPERESYVDRAIQLRNFAVAFLFVVFAGPAVWTIVRTGSVDWGQAGPGWRSYCLALGFVLTIGPVLWNWFEATQFNHWVYSRYPDDKDKDAREREIQIFKTHVESAKALWAGVLALVAAAVLRFK